MDRNAGYQQTIGRDDGPDRIGHVVGVVVAARTPRYVFWIDRLRVRWCGSTYLRRDRWSRLEGGGGENGGAGSGKLLPSIRQVIHITAKLLRQTSNNAPSGLFVIVNEKKFVNAGPGADWKTKGTPAVSGIMVGQAVFRRATMV